MKEKKIDIVIPTYNGAHNLPELLESIKKQRYQDYNCYVIDDNSTDNTVNIIRTNYKWVKLIEQNKNKGPSNNRNIAIRHGTSPYIAIFDDDSFLKDTDWLLKGLSILEKNPTIGQLATMIVSGYDQDILLDCGIQGEGPIFGGIYWKRNRKNVLGRHKVSRKVLGACTAGTILRRDVFEKVGGFDPKYYYLAEDLDLSIRIHLSGYDVIYDPSLITCHYESQAMGKKAKLKKYLYLRNSLLVMLENFPARHAGEKIALLSVANFYSLIKVTLNRIILRNPGASEESPKDFLRASLFLISKTANIIAKRRQSNKFRKRSREYLIDINTQLTSETALHLPVKSLIYSITNKCNAKCNICFQHKYLNKKVKLLTLDQIRKMLWSFKELTNVVLGGGEPFLRENIDAICYCLIDKNNNTSITISTNGSLPAVMYEKVKSILTYGCRSLTISLSLDGDEKYHNDSRGIRDLFNKVQVCYEKLMNLKAIFGDELHVQINTCVSPANIDQLDFLFDYISRKMPETSWTFEPIRGTFDTSQASELKIEDWEYLQEKGDIFYNRDKDSNYGTMTRLLKYSIDTLKSRKQVVSCYGGEEFISIDFAGNIFPCESLPEPSINIAQLDFDINQLLVNEQWNEAVDSIKKGKCYCTHFCWLAYSLGFEIVGGK